MIIIYKSINFADIINFSINSTPTNEDFIYHTCSQESGPAYQAI